MKAEKVFKLIGGALAFGTFGALVWLENRRPLRRSARESKITRTSRNLAVAGVGAVALQLIETPVTRRLTELVERKQFGLLKIVRLPLALEIILAVALLDYTLYWWHVITHKVPFLWRFHRVHHVDLDMDAATALRFHAGELTVSVAWRAMQILVIGVSPASLSAWQMLLFPSILFHHSNVRLAPRFERMLSRFIVTPRLHGIHHSIEQSETDSNWSSGLTIWDRLHKTLKTDVSQDEIVIGVPAFQNPAQVTLPKLLSLPFVEQKSGWELPAEAVN